MSYRQVGEVPKASAISFVHWLLDLSLNALTGQVEVISKTRLEYPMDQWVLVYTDADVHHCIASIPDARFGR